MTEASLRKSLILDPIHPSDWQNLTITYCCEQCVHFDPESESCTIGYVANHHREARQQRLYELTGRVAFCRFNEID